MGAGLYLDPTALYGLTPRRINQYVNRIDFNYDRDGRTNVTLELTVNDRAEITEDKLEKIGQIINGNYNNPTPERNSNNRTIAQLRTISEQNRQTGSTTFLLKSAIFNPDCYFVVKDVNSMISSRNLYHKIIEEDPMFSEIFETNGSREPTFTTLNQMEIIHGHNRLPIVFDTSCFF